MKKKVYYVYEFKELSEEIQEKILEKYWNINVDYEWWTYDDYYNLIAEEYGIKIDMRGVSFDLDRNEIAFDTFNHARSKNWTLPIQIVDLEKFLNKAGLPYNEDGYVRIDHKHYSGGRIKNIIFSDGYDDDALQEALDEMLDKILHTLKEEYRFLTSRQAIIETILANNFWFKENGEIDFSPSNQNEE